MQKSLKNRDIYLRQLKAFQGTEMIKVITGIRRCGKSCLMKLMVEHLRGSGIGDKQIVEMNFESMRFAVMTAKDLYRYVSERVIPGKRMYLFFDEVQRLDGWENAVNSFRVDYDRDIYNHRLQRPPAVLRAFHLSLRAVCGDQGTASIVPGVSGFPRIYRIAAQDDHRTDEKANYRCRRGSMRPEGAL